MLAALRVVLNEYGEERKKVVEKGEGMGVFSFKDEAFGDYIPKKRGAPYTLDKVLNDYAGLNQLIKQGDVISREVFNRSEEPTKTLKAKLEEEKLSMLFQKNRA